MSKRSWNRPIAVRTRTEGERRAEEARREVERLDAAEERCADDPTAESFEEMEWAALAVARREADARAERERIDPTVDG